MYTEQVYDKLAFVKAAIENHVAPYTYGAHVMIDPYEVEVENPDDPDEQGQRYALFGILDKLGDVLYELEYWNTPVMREGILTKNSSGRYELDGYELSSGCSVEILEAPDEDEPARWVRTRVEHDGEDYYLVSGHQRLLGKRARVR